MGIDEAIAISTKFPNPKMDEKDYFTHPSDYHRKEMITGSVSDAIDIIAKRNRIKSSRIIEYYKRHDIQVCAYTPIARFDDRLMRLPLLKRIGDKYGKSVTQVVLRWHIQNGIIPLVRTLNPVHQKENLDVFDFELTDEEMKAIDAVNINSRLRYDPDNCDFSIL